MDDDSLARLMASIDPAKTPFEAELTSEQRSLLKNITSGKQHVAQHRNGSRRWVGASIASVVITVVVITVFVITSNLVHPSQAAAFSPPPLSYTPTPQNAEQVLETAKSQLLKSPGPRLPVRSSESTGWYIQIDNLADKKTRVAISPQVTNFNWAEDRSGHLIVLAGEPYWADSDTGNVPASVAPPAGQVLSDVSFAAGEFDIPTVQTPGTSPQAMMQILVDFGLPRDADTRTIMSNVRSLFSLWTLTNEQHAALLQTILLREDIEVLGITTDRLGHSVIGVAASDSRFQETMLISTATGRIIGMETRYVTAMEGIPAGTVVEYTIWKDTI